MKRCALLPMSKKLTPKTLVLLDTHAILHRAYHALPDFASPGGEPTGALYGVVTMLLRIIEDFKPDYIAACYDLPEPTYRHHAFTGYKSTRTKTDEALVAQIIRSYDIFKTFGIPVYEVAGFEADDMLGTIAYQLKEQSDIRVIIASGDMDTLQCVDKKRVQVYTLKKGIKDTILYDEAAVKERFGFPPKLVPDYKGLRGDTSDNIPGIVGIGEKTATEIITTFGSLDAIYKKLKKYEPAFVAAGIKPRMIELLKNGEEEAQFSKMLATIRIDAPITYELPTQSWRDTADIDGIANLFSELGFRNLGARVSALLGQVQEISDEMKIEHDPNLVTQCQILLWLLESERTNASAEAIIDYGRAYFDTTDLQEIHTKLYVAVSAIPTLKKLYEEVEQPLMAVITRMNQNGIALDVDYLKTLADVMHEELIKLENAIYNHVGIEFNINSPKQLGEALFDTLGLKPKNQKKTATGQRSTKESELEKMRDDHPVIEHILRYRTVQKLVSTYVDALPQLRSADGRLRTTFLQTGTTTGRLASQSPNVQNIPTRTEEGKSIRRAFVAAPGCSLVSIDYSQIELRIAAILSKDAKLVDIFRRGEDVHTGVAVRVFGVDGNEVTSEMRRKAKIINFGILYGMGVNALRTNLGEETTREEAQSFLTAYFQTFTRLAEYLEETKAKARDQGYTETLFGRRRQFPGITSSAPFIRAQAERMAINAPIQGTQADIIRVAMNRIDEFLTAENLHDEVKMVLQVHDELVFEIIDSKVSELVVKLNTIMRDVLTLEQTHQVPILTDIAVGKNWADMKDYLLT